MRTLAALPFLGLLLVAAPARAQLAPDVDPDAPSVSTRPERSKVQLGEPFHVYVTIVHKPDMKVDLPATLPLGDAWSEVGDRTTLDSTDPDGLQKTTFVLSVAALELDAQTFPPIQVGYQAKGEHRQLATLPFTVDVGSVVGKGAEQLKPIAPPVTVMTRDLTLVWAGLFALGGLLVAGGGWYAWRVLRRRRPDEAAAARVLPPDEAALERLRALAASGALDDDDRRPVYFQLTEILREYLGRRFGFDAPEQTTEELVASLSRHAAPETVDALGAWLRACDLVKFARVPAARDDAERALADAVSLVERTRPAPPPPEPVAAAPAPAAAPPSAPPGA
jgi:hypothetical protein